MLGGIDNKGNYNALMKQIQSVIDADSTNKQRSAIEYEGKLETMKKSL